MPTFETCLLRVKSITPEALSLLVTMMQVSNANNAIEINREELRKSWNRFADGRRFSQAKLTKYTDELLDKNLIQSPKRVHPFGGISEGISEEQANQIVKAAQENYRSGLPDPEKEEQAQLGRFLKSIDLEILCQKLKRHYVKDEDGNILIVDGRRKTYMSPVWDYGFAHKLLKKWGFRKIASTCFSVWEKGLLDKISYTSLKEKKKKYTSYIVKALGGELNTKQHERSSRHR